MASEEDELPTTDAKVEEGEETRGYPITRCAAKMLVISQNIANTTK